MLTVYFKRKPPAFVYAVRNEQGFLTPGVFSCNNAFSFRSCPAWIRYGIVEFNVPLDTVETGALSSDVHLLFSNGGPAT